jgi:hypothetical protein
MTIALTIVVVGIVATTIAIYTHELTRWSRR